MSINNVRLLRALIREMVTEAPYRSSQRVVLGGVQFDGTPDIKGMLIAGGVVGLIKLYDWADGLCVPDAENSDFPIKYSKAAAAKVAGARAEFPSAEWQAYKTAIQVIPPSAPAVSDTAKLMTFYGDLRDAATTWAAGQDNYATLSAVVQTAVFESLKKILTSYTGCPTVTLNEMPMKSRKEYIEFLKNIGGLAQNTFETNLTAQRDEMTSAFPAKSVVITTEVNGRVANAKSGWTRTLPDLK